MGDFLRYRLVELIDLRLSLVSTISNCRFVSAESLKSEVVQQSIAFANSRIRRRGLLLFYFAVGFGFHDHGSLERVSIDRHTVPVLCSRGGLQCLTSVPDSQLQLLSMLFLSRVIVCGLEESDVERLSSTKCSLPLDLDSRIFMFERQQRV